MCLGSRMQRVSHPILFIFEWCSYYLLNVNTFHYSLSTMVPSRCIRSKREWRMKQDSVMHKINNFRYMIQDFMYEMHRMEMKFDELVKFTAFLVTLIETEMGNKIQRRYNIFDFSSEKSTGITFSEYRFPIQEQRIGSKMSSIPSTLALTAVTSKSPIFHAFSILKPGPVMRKKCSTKQYNLAAKQFGEILGRYRQSLTVKLLAQAHCMLMLNLTRFTSLYFLWTLSHATLCAAKWKYINVGMMS